LTERISVEHVERHEQATNIIDKTTGFQ